jgi:copper resistance protein D
MPPIALLRALHIAATLVIGGAIAFDLLVLGRGARAIRDAAATDDTRRWLRRVAAGAVVVALLSWGGWLALVAIGMSGLPPAQALAPEVLRTVIARTTFGHVWAIRVVLLIAVAACLATPPRSRGRGAVVRDAIAAVAGAALVGSLAATGHAVAADATHLWVDLAHLVAAALWLGMLPPLCFVVHRASAQARAGSLEFASDAVRRFSPPALAAVVVLAATGVANAAWLVDSPADLASTRYGVLLLAKLAVFALMLLIALINRIWWTPRLAPQAAPAETDPILAMRRLRRNVVAELLLAAAVLLLVGVLGITAPPSSRKAMQQMHGMERP